MTGVQTCALPILTMQKLSQFTGTKSDFEFRQAQRIVMGDATMTPTEIQAGLALLRRVEVEAARKWSTDMNSIDPTRYGFTEKDISRQKEKARSILNRFDQKSVEDQLRRNYERGNNGP